MHWRTMMMSEFCGLLWVRVVLCTGLGLVVVVSFHPSNCVPSRKVLNYNRTHSTVHNLNYELIIV